MKNNKHALEFLKEEHAMEYQGIDDDMPDNFDEWIANLDEIGWVTIMSRFRESILSKIETLEITGIDNAKIIQKAIVRHIN